VLLLISITQDSDHGLLVAIAPAAVTADRAIRLRAAPRRMVHRLESFAQRMLGDDHKLAALIDGARLDAQIRALCRHPACCCAR
jgi:hypothetical protein